MIRLNKYIADAGVCTRREADKLIESGKIKVNNVVTTTLGVKVQKNDKVEYQGKLLVSKKFQYVLFNKPKGIHSFLDDPHIKKTMRSLISRFNEGQLMPVRELDAETCGLLLLTDDKELIKRMSSSEIRISEKYILEVHKEVFSETLEKLKNGIQLKEGVFRFDKAHYGDKGKNKKKLIVTISCGTRDVVKTLIEHLGYKVMALDRVEFSALKKGPLSRGKCRLLTAKEVGFLKMIKGSS